MKKASLTILLLITTVITSGAGYVGTLPDIEAEFEYLRKNTDKKINAPYTIKELDKKNEETLKPIPAENDDYIDIIIKKDKTPKYIHDINSLILILEKLRKCINTNEDIQKFNAVSSNLIDHIEYIKQEYFDKPESNYMSYKILQNLSAETRDVATFRSNGHARMKYYPYSSEENIYTKENLEIKLNSLLKNVNETLFILKNLE